MLFLNLLLFKKVNWKAVQMTPKNKIQFYLIQYVNIQAVCRVWFLTLWKIYQHLFWDKIPTNSYYNINPDDSFPVFAINFDWSNWSHLNYWRHIRQKPIIDIILNWPFVSGKSHYLLIPKYIIWCFQILDKNKYTELFNT